ncbi:glycosyltransferase family 4 protein [Planococcus donghaensis]|uniref:glycosyltransferase family 4 protein n=1 Tax=Planococcus donghaensis TaxID=414778 RepID=UPI0037361B03
MNITVITSGTMPIPPVDGGAVENLIDLYLKDNEVHGQHEFTVYSTYSKAAENLANNYKHTKFIFIKTENVLYKFNKIFRYLINRIPSIYIGNAFISRIKREIGTGKSDIYIFENCPMYVLSLKSVISGKKILHLHNDTLYKGIKLDKKIIGNYDSIFSISEYLTKRVNSIESDCSVLTLYNGIDMEKLERSLYHESSVKLKRKYKIQDDDIVILYTGRLDENKGVKHLIQAFKLIKDSTKMKLVIAGAVFYEKKDTDPFVAELQKLTYDTQEKVIFTGYIKYEEIGSLYAIADIGVVPSLIEEGFGLTVLEHMAMGTALITTNSGAIPEMVDNDCAIILKRDSNFIENLSKSIVKLVKDSNLRNQMGQQGKLKSMKFTDTKYNEKLFKLLGEVNEK